MLGERALYHAIHHYLAHYHAERNHQGLDNQLIAPEGAWVAQWSRDTARTPWWVAALLLSRRGVTRDTVVSPYGMPTMNVYELYEQTIKSLPAAERLRLAVLILNDIPPQSVVDDSENWTEVDLQEFTQASWQHLDQHLEDEAYG